MQFRGGMNELWRQAARIQRKLDDKKKELADNEMTASSASDKVKATVTWGRKLSRVEIDKDFLAQEGLDMACDAVCAAVNTAMAEAEKAMEAELEKVTGGVKIPGVT